MCRVTILASDIQLLKDIINGRVTVLAEYDVFGICSASSPVVEQTYIHERTTFTSTAWTAARRTPESRRA
jgi:hypothetical protein